MHWFKILLICLLGLNVFLAIYRGRKGEHTVTKKAQEAPLTAVLELLLLWGVITYL